MGTQALPDELSPMNYSHFMRFIRSSVVLLGGLIPLCAVAQAPASQLPDGPNRETVQRVCSSCHSVQMFSGRGMTRGTMERRGLEYDRAGREDLRRGV